MELEEELRKLGLRVRTRTVQASKGDIPGRVGFDEQDRARFEWSDDAPIGDGEDADRLSNQMIAPPRLTIADDEPAANAPMQNNPQGLRMGYNPYESGLLAGKERKPRRNLHELSRWIDMKKKFGK